MSIGKGTKMRNGEKKRSEAIRELRQYLGFSLRAFGNPLGYSGTQIMRFENEVTKPTDAVMEKKIAQICFEGPKETLNMTENTQPCILTTEYAAYAALTEAGIKPDAMAGFSLGEYGALAAAGVFSFEDALRIIKIRAKAM